MPTAPSATARNSAIAIAAICIATYSVATAAAQSATATPGQSPGLQGTGPGVNVQNSANGTLDVSGADPNMAGENFRGSFGASRSQPGWSMTPALPKSSFQSPGGVLNFNPSLPGPSVPRDSSAQADDADLAAYPDLILPRFRGQLSESVSSNSGGQSSLRRKSPDAWRYRYSGGRWWYWPPSEAWLYWDGARWQPFNPRP